jgi:predicted branched-subunit amino acid permease
MNMPLPPQLPPEGLCPRVRQAGWRGASTAGRTRRATLFWVGVRDMASVSVGLAAWAFMTGVAMVGSGMSVGESVLMSVLVFAGSAQLAALPLIAAGAPMWVIWPRRCA